MDAPVNVRLACAVLAQFVPLAAFAQQTAPTPSPAPRTIVGVVTDTAGKRIDSVDVFISRLRRRTTSDSAGEFRFADIEQDVYLVGARRIGFYPQSRTVPVGPEGGAVSFELLPMARGLPPVVTAASRGGLSGMVSDTALAPVAEAEVIVLSAGLATVTDSTGSFFLEAKPGRYMVQVNRRGYRSSLVSVNVPKDSGRRVQVWLTHSARAMPVRQAVALFDLKMMLNRRVGGRYRMFTREDIMRSGKNDVVELTQQATVRRVDDNCMALINGGPLRDPLWLFNASDIEAMEVYENPPPRRRTTSITGSRPIQGPSLDACPTVFVWLRQ